MPGARHPHLGMSWWGGDTHLCLQDTGSSSGSQTTKPTTWCGRRRLWEFPVSSHSWPPNPKTPTSGLPNMVAPSWLRITTCFSGLPLLTREFPWGKSLHIDISRASWPRHLVNAVWMNGLMRGFSEWAARRDWVPQREGRRASSDGSDCQSFERNGRLEHDRGLHHLSQD